MSAADGGGAQSPADRFRAALARTGHTQASFARLLQGYRPDLRPGTMARQVRRWATGEVLAPAECLLALDLLPAADERGSAAAAGGGRGAPSRHPVIAPTEEQMRVSIGPDEALVWSSVAGIASGTAAAARRAVRDGADPAHVLEEVLLTLERAKRRQDEVVYAPDRAARKVSA